MGIRKGLLALSALISVSVGGQAQSSSNVKSLMEQIQDAERRSLPRTQDSLVSVLSKTALGRKDLESYLWAEQHRVGGLSIENAMRLRQEPWLTEVDKLMVDLSALVDLRSRYLRGNYSLSSGAVIGDYVSIPERAWNKETYRYAMQDLLSRLFGQPQLLNKPTRQGQRAIDAICLTLRDKMQVHFYSFRRDKDLYKSVLSGLESYIKAIPQSEQALSARWLYTEVLASEEDKLPLYKDLEKEYHLRPEMLPFLSSYVGWLSDNSERALAYQLLSDYLPIAKGDDQKQIYQDLDNLRQPHLSASVARQTVFGSLEQKLEVVGYLVKKAEVRVYRYPMVVNWEKIKDHKTLGTLEYNTEIHFDPSRKWEWIKGTTAIPHSKYGLYRVEVNIKELHSPGKGQGFIDTLESEYQLTKTYAVSESYNNDHTKHYTRRYLNAITGKPLASLPILFASPIPNKNKTRPQSLKVKTNALGAIPDSLGWNYAYSYILNEQDPLYISYQGGEGRTYTDPQKRKNTIFLATDRAVYRPGQEVHIYGYTSELGLFTEHGRVVPNAKLTIEMYGPQRKVLAKQSLTSDKYGRFYTSLRLKPDQELSTNNSIVVTWDDGTKQRTTSRRYFSIAEYKRPQMELFVGKPSGALSLGDTLSIPLSVRTYSGADVEGVDLKIEVQADRILQGNHIRYEQIGRESRAFKLKTDHEGKARFVLPLSALLGYPAVSTNSETWVHYHLDISAVSPTGEVVSTYAMYEVTGRKPTLALNGPKVVARSGVEPKWKWEATGLKPLDSVRVEYNVTYQGQEITSGSTLIPDELKLGSWVASAKSGLYTINYKTKVKDVELTGSYPFSIYDMQDKTIQIPDTAIHILGTKHTYQHGKAPELYYATSLKDAYVFYTLRFGTQQLKQGVLRPQQGVIERVPIAMPKDTLQVVELSMYAVQSGDIYQASQTYTREEANKNLQLKWKSFRDRTRAGSDEKWTLQVLHEGKPVSATLASWAYDASLDAIMAYDIDNIPAKIENYIYSRPFITRSLLDTTERGLFATSFETRFRQRGGSGLDGVYGAELYEASPASMSKFAARSNDLMATVAGLAPPSPKSVVIATVAPLALRQNFSELAYIRPMLETNEDGEVSWTFRMPDALTRWRVITVAHTPDLKTAIDNQYVETYREMQVEPYLPRFIRLGDSLTITSSVRNRSDKSLEGKLWLELFSPVTKQSLHKDERTFRLAKGKSETYSFALNSMLCEGLDSVGVRFTANTVDFSDGEEHLIPIEQATSEVVRTEAITMSGAKMEQFDLGKSLFPANAFIPEKGTLKIRVESNPLYLALLSLPQLSYFDSENAVNYATALYALNLSRKIAQAPGLVQWVEDRTQAIGQGLHGDREKQLNTDIRQHPWRRSLETEQELRSLANLKKLLTLGHQKELEIQYITKLQGLQKEDGGFAWFTGMPSSRYMTLYIVKLLYRRQAVLGKTDNSALSDMLSKAWAYLHTGFRENIREYKRRGSTYSYDPSSLQYLYLLSLDEKQAEVAKDNVAYLEPKLRERVYQLGHQDKAMAALSYAKSNPKLAGELLESLRQHLTTDTQGTYYSTKDKANYWWYNRSYEALTMTIELMERLSPERDAALILGMKRWLLAQKRTTQWSNSLSTAEAVYALTRGQQFDAKTPANTTAISLQLSDGTLIKQTSQERQGLDLEFTRSRYPQTLSLSPTGAKGEVWASAIASYTLPIKYDTPSGRELQTERAYFVQTIHEGEPRLIPLKEGQSLNIGDRLIVRLTLKLDRHLDFVAITDPRLGCAEPIRQVPGFHWGAGTGYYIEPRDKSTVFYIHSLSAGTYTLDYEQRVVRQGVYQAASAQTQSIYAPEYSSSTGYSGTLSVR